MVVKWIKGGRSIKKDAHYYAILAFCRACGFKKEAAYQVAYASQFVDDAKINHIVLKENTHLEHDRIDNKPSFFNMATCHSYFRIKTFNYEAMINNTTAFHFVPGCKGENFSRKLRCAKESPVILDLLQEVLQEDDLIKLGIILHVYADSYSHQGFSGILSKVNDIKECKVKTKGLPVFFDRVIQLLKRLDRNRYETFFDSAIPAYGHGQALDYPDRPYLTWSYQYDYSDEFRGSYKRVEINNPKRYKQAFTKIQKHLKAYLENHPQYRDTEIGFQDFDILMDALVAKTTDGSRERNWRKLLTVQGLFGIGDSDWITYDDTRWLREAFANFESKKFHERKVEEVELADGFANCHWYRFYLAVKWYKSRFFQYCIKYQLDIPR